MADRAAAHVHEWKQVARFKWLTDRWFRKYRCACGAEWFS